MFYKQTRDERAKKKSPVLISVYAHEGVCVFHGSILPRVPNTTVSAPLTKDD